MAKRVNFFDGATSATSPIFGTIDVSNLSTYADDAAFETANGPGEEGDIYANTTDNVIRYHNGTAWTSVILSNVVGQANGVASLDGSGKVPVAQMPAVAISEVFVVADEPAMIALTAEEGDVAKRTDLNESFIHNGGTAGDATDWTQLHDVNVYTSPLTTDGDIMYYNSGDARLPVGTNGQILTVTAGQPAWEDAPATGNFWSDPVDSSIIPNVADDHNIGSGALPFSRLYAKTIILDDATEETYIRVFGTNNTFAEFGTQGTNEPTDAPTDFAHIRTNTASDLAIYTQNSSGTGASTEIFVGTGDNSSTGDSGSITIKTGTVTSGTRGKITMKDGSEGNPGYVWTEGATAGEGSWQAPAGGYTDEEAQDAVGTILTDTSTIDFTYDDVTPQITAAVKFNDAGSGTADVWSASKISTELSGKADTIHTHAASDVTSGTFADARISQSSVTQHQGAISHDALADFVVNEHIDWTQPGAGTIDPSNYVGGAGDLWSDAVDSDILPTGADSTYDLGSPSAKFAEAHVDTYNVSDAGSISKIAGAALPGQSVLFDGGSGDEVRISNTIDHNDTQNFSYNIWLKSTDTASAVNAVIMQSDGTNANKRLQSWMQSGDLHVVMGDGTSNIKYFNTIGANLANGNWHMVTITLDNTSSFKIYVDGTLRDNDGVDVSKNTDSAFPGNNALSTSVDLVLGNASAIQSWPFDGRLDEFTYFDKELTSGDVTDLWNTGSGKTATSSSASANVVSHYPINNDVAITTIEDVQGPHDGVGSSVALDSDNAIAASAPDSLDIDAGDGDVTLSSTTTNGAKLATQPDGTEATAIATTGWTNTELAGKADTSHNHAASDITSGTFADARISQSSVTQHEGSISHDNLSGFVSNEHIDWTQPGAGTIDPSNYAAGGGDLWSDAVDSDIVPTGADSTYDLGTSTDRFAEAHVDTYNVEDVGTIHKAAGAVGAGKSLAFPNTAGNEVRISHTSDHQDTQNFSYNIWLKSTDTASAVNAIVMQSDGSAAEKRFQSWMSGGEFEVVMGNGTSNVKYFTTIGANIADGNWHMVTITLDNTSTMKVYIDGTLRDTDGVDVSKNTDNSFTGNNALVGTLDLVLGNSSSGPDWKFSGKLDDFAYFDKELTSGDVTDLWNSGNGTPADTSTASANVVSYYPVNDDTAISTIEDTVGVHDGVGTSITLDSDNAVGVPGLDVLTIDATGKAISMIATEWGIHGSTAPQSAAYAPTNDVEDRAFDADATSTAELADVLATLIKDLQAKGIIG